MLAMGRLARGGFFQAGLQLFQQAGEIPVQRAGGLDGAVGKTVKFFNGDFAVVERAEHEPAAVGAEVAGEIMCGHGENASRILCGAGAVSKGLPSRRGGVFCTKIKGTQNYEHPSRKPEGAGANRVEPA